MRERCRVSEEELANDTPSIFDYAPQEEYKLDTTKATTYKPDAFELELARQEQQEHEAKIQLIINRMMGEV